MSRDQRATGKHKKDLSSLWLVLLFLIGMGILLYPPIADINNRLVQSRAIVDYDDRSQAMKAEDNDDQFRAAEAYNDEVAQASFPLIKNDIFTTYDDVLNINGDGIIGHLDIPRLEVEIPVYHGTSEAVLAEGAGHLKGSSLPVATGDVHSVLSAHRGLPSARLFTDLDKMEVGDRFSMRVLDQIFTYQVDQILTVLPDEMEALSIQKGRNLCTLMTCTPYGINSHRLLVRGSLESVQAAKGKVRMGHRQIEAVVKADPLPFILALVLLVLLIVILVIKRKREKRTERARPAVVGSTDLLEDPRER